MGIFDNILGSSKPASNKFKKIMVNSDFNIGDTQVTAGQYNLLPY